MPTQREVKEIHEERKREALLCLEMRRTLMGFSSNSMEGIILKLSKISHPLAVDAMKDLSSITERFSGINLSLLRLAQDLDE